MHTGDRVRLASEPACRILGIVPGQVGIIKDVDATYPHTAVLISFPEVSVYTSALSDADVDVIAPGTQADAHLDANGKLDPE